MRNNPALNKIPWMETANSRDIPERISNKGMRWVGFFIFVLLAAPRMRFVAGSVPLYLVDGLIAVLLVSALNRPGLKRRTLHPIARLAGAYMVFVLLGELRGMFEYGMPLESIYMMVSFSLAISLVFILPKLLITSDDLKPLMKGTIAGLLVTSVIVIMYSVGPLRPLVMNAVFSNKFLCPESENIAMATLIFGGVDEAMRGRSLIGAATMTAGFLGSIWPLAFLAYRWPGLGRFWKRLAWVASIITPFAILMTYGRTAWLIVAIIGVMISIFGFAGGRRLLFVTVIGFVLLVYHFGLFSDLFMVDRLISRTEMTMAAPFEEESGRERFLSYVEPFEHLEENPLWLIIGAGRTGEKLSLRGQIKAQLYDEAGLATHSAFSMAYYCFGLPAAILQVLLMLFGFRLILRRLRSPERRKQEQTLIWQSLLMAWCGLFLWWLSGHAMVGDPRGAMLLFFMFGLLLACDRIQSLEHNDDMETTS